MLYYESPEALVPWNQEIKTVVIEWKGFATRDEYQIPLNKSLELLIANKATKSIANTLLSHIILLTFLLRYNFLSQAWRTHERLLRYI